MSCTPLPPVPRKVHLWCIFFYLPPINCPLPPELNFRENTASGAVRTYSNRPTKNVKGLLFENEVIFITNFESYVLSFE